MTDLTANLLESAFRWIHVVAGVLWLGTLYFFAWIGGRELASLPTVTTRALHWVRWSAAANWVSGILLLGLVDYHTRLVPLGRPASLALGVTFGGVVIYDWLAARGPSSPRTQLVLGWSALSAVALLLERAGLPYRAYAIHLGALLGSIMAFNVWFRIWPAYRASARPPASAESSTPDLSQAALRSRHNAYLSVPLLFLMVSPHASTAMYALHPYQPLLLSSVLIVGFALAHVLERLATVTAEG